MKKYETPRGWPKKVSVENKRRYTLLNRNVRVKVWGMVAAFRDGSYTDKLLVVLSEKI